MYNRRALALTLAVALIGFLGTSMQAQENRRPQRSKLEQQDIDTLVQLVNGVAAGTQPAPSEVGVTWVGNHYLKTDSGRTYVPFTVNVDRRALGKKEVSMYVRAVSKAAAPAAPAGQAAPTTVTFPWDDINFIDVPDNGRVARALVLPPGEYDVFIALKERATDERNAAPGKTGFVRETLTVPSFEGSLQSSSVIVAANVEVLDKPLSDEQQRLNPYTFGSLKIDPMLTQQFPKAGELNVFFWIYGVQPDANKKPDLTIEYNFHQKTADGEKYFNRTPPQALNAQTLPPEFDVTSQDLFGNQGVPLASFPAGDYRLEITITDKLSGSTVKKDVPFTVAGS
ncbi:MAG: hypothetical protein HOP14_11760 [Acidobacteria bacterium]|nr:hypothetical protein [Acidobacteriota bacterium]